MKKRYETPEIEILILSEEADIITASGNLEGGDDFLFMYDSTNEKFEN